MQAHPSQSSRLEIIELQDKDTTPTASVIVLHGLGADGSDFVPVCRELGLGDGHAVRFVLPSAPRIPVTINGGHVMRAWYDIRGTEAHGREDEAGLRQSRRLIDGLIEREKERGIPARRIFLAGFSQGCAMTLLTGLRHAERLGGLIGLSGYLPLAAALESERSDANADVPIFLVHGRQDQVIPINRALASRDRLVALGYPVEWHEYAMAHSVCMEEIVDLDRWLTARLDEAA